MGIRIAKPGDAPRIGEIYRPYVTDTAYSFEYEAPSPQEMERRIRSVTELLPWLVWEEDGRVMGYAYAALPFTRAAYRWCAEVSVYLAPEMHRQGVGKRLYTAVEAILKALGYEKVYAVVTTENTGSLRFHQALGYRITAQMPGCGWKFGRWHGTVWLEKSLSSGTMPNDFPAPWTEIVKNNENLLEFLDNIPLSGTGKM